MAHHLMHELDSPVGLGEKHAPHLERVSEALRRTHRECRREGQAQPLVVARIQTHEPPKQIADDLVRPLRAGRLRCLVRGPVGFGGNRSCNVELVGDRVEHELTRCAGRRCVVLGPHPRCNVEDSA